MNKIWQKQIQNNKLFHAYILFGQNSDLIEQEIGDFIKKLNINVVDVSIVETDTTIKISQIRDLLTRLYIQPHSSKYKLVIIKNADKITPEAANKLLKIIEEPPKNVIFILSSSLEKNILPTIISRCQKIKIFNDDSILLPKESVDLINKIISGNIVEKFSLADKLAKEDDVNRLLDDWLVYFRANMLQNPVMLNNIEAVYEKKKMLKFNVNKKLLLENLFLELG
jgi:hypothetical protein